jgi:phospholipase C
MNSAIRSWPTEVARLDPDFIERANGKWRISVKNINQDARRMQVVVRSVHAIAPIGRRDIPFSILNNMAEVALQKVLPTIEYDSGHFVISTPTQFLDLVGVDRTFSLGSAITKFIDDLPTFTPHWVRLMSRAEFVAYLRQRQQAIRSEFQVHITKARNAGNDTQALALEGRRNRAIGACEGAIARLTALSASRAAFCIVLEGMFTNPDVDLRYIGTIARVDNQLPQLGLVFSEDLRFTDVISNLAVDLSPLLIKEALATAGLVLLTGLVLGPVLAALALVGLVKLFNSINSIDYLDIEEQIRQRIRQKGAMIGQYVKRAVERLTDIGAVALDAQIRPGASADGSDSLQVQFFNPSTLRPPRPWTPAGDELSGTSSTPSHTTEIVRIGAGELRPRAVRAVTYVPASTDRTAGYVEQLTRVARETPGPFPEGFEVPEPATLARLDDHDCIAVVMMENRSYAHFFHDLPLAYPDRGYRQTPATYRNTPSPGFTEPFAVVSNTSIGIGRSLIFPGVRPLDPSHNWEHTHFQVGGGTADTEGSGQMRGFAIDFAHKSDSPQIVMSHFGIDDLPVYKGLARHYPVCDRWFAALPVGTFPNRLAALQGNVPFLHNIQMDNATLGYLEDYSIFDLLNSQEISWTFFEGDIGTVRLYDRFRLDVNHVRPFKNFEWILSTYAQANSMPRVIFIEPQFLFGNDDHPPMSVDHGQAFIRHVVGTFIKYGLLDRTLFVITYDEHGGFFDHVPPPGTAAAVASGSNYGAVEILFPQDPDAAPRYLGVRVPSLVLSKWTDARANHTVLDHTAILKTILLHNRTSISTEQFGRFGGRVSKRGHLGQVLDLSMPRSIDYAAVAADIGYDGSAPAATNAVVSARSVGMTTSHPANVLRGIALPRGRTFYM